MDTAVQSAGGAGVVTSSATRNTELTVRELVDLYMAAYAGRDSTRPSRLAWWCARLGDRRVADVMDDDIHFALEELATKRGRYYAGRDADGRPIFKAHAKPLAPATVNRYNAAAAALFTFAVRKRLVPRGWQHPCKGVERRPEDNEQTRFLDDGERERLLAACKTSKWPRLYLLVLMAITTGARRGELEDMRWGDVDLERAVAHVLRTKNSDPKVLPLVPAVIEELRRFGPGAREGLIFASSRRPDVPYNAEPVWQAALTAANVKDFRFHDLRHTCASYLAQNGATLLEIGEILGHRQLSVTKRYSHLTTANKAALVGRVLGGIR